MRWKDNFSGFSKFFLLCGMVFLLVVTPIFATGLAYSSYFGGTNGYDEGVGVAVDSAGMIYIGGTAGSSDFPTTVGAYTTSLAGSLDIFVCKINPFSTGSSSLIYCTLLGGNDDDYDDNIAIDSSGKVYILGATYSSNFPVTSNAYDTVYQGNEKGSLTVLNSTGSTLLYSTYLGGESNDVVSNISVDTAGNAYICGWTSSVDFPITPGAFDSVYQEGYQAFALKLNPTLSGKSSLVYSTFLAGSGGDNEAWENYVDLAGNQYIGGYTNSVDFSITSSAYQTGNHGGYDAFVTKLNSTGTALLYSSYLGGGLNDNVAGMTADNAGGVYLIGYTASSTDFPVTANAYSTTYHGGINDAFIAKFNTNYSGTSSLVYATLLGGSGEDNGWGIAVDSAGNAYFVGFTESANFPTTPGAFDTTYHGGDDIFVGKLSSNGSSLLYSTLLGGEGNDEAFTIAVDTAGNAYITGYSDSTDYQTTSGAFKPAFNSSEYRNSIITKLNIPNNVAVEDWDLYGMEGSDERN